MEHGTPDIQTPNTTEQQEVNWEKRYKDVQASYTQSQQENSKLRKDVTALSAELDVIKPLVAPAYLANLTEEDNDRLLDLRDTDPEAWRREMNRLEAEAQQGLSEKVSQAASNANTQFELSRREQLLDAFISKPDTVLSIDNLDDIPVRLSKRLEAGEISFEDYLVEADTYLKAGKTIKQPPNTPNEPDLLGKGGSAEVSQPTKADLNNDYKTTVW